MISVSSSLKLSAGAKQHVLKLFLQTPCQHWLRIKHQHISGAAAAPLLRRCRRRMLEDVAALPAQMSSGTPQRWSKHGFTSETRKYASDHRTESLSSSLLRNLKLQTLLKWLKLPAADLHVSHNAFGSAWIFPVVKKT